MFFCFRLSTLGALLCHAHALVVHGTGCWGGHKLVIVGLGRSVKQTAFTFRIQDILHRMAVWVADAARQVIDLLVGPGDGRGIGG